MEKQGIQRMSLFMIEHFASIKHFFILNPHQGKVNM